MDKAEKGNKRPPHLITTKGKREPGGCKIL
jgi:hypothetical protein